MVDRCVIWPARVDTNYWPPDPTVNRDEILIFEKQNKGPFGPIQPYADYLCGLGWKVRIIRYGSFRHDYYLHRLQHACLLVGFVVNESRGLVWAETWSVDVPTLIWRNEITINGGRYYESSTAPYLTEENVIFFNDLEDFKIHFAYWEAHQDKFQPRKWVSNNMSDKVCALRLYKKAIEWQSNVIKAS